MYNNIIKNNDNFYLTPGYECLIKSGLYISKHVKKKVSYFFCFFKSLGHKIMKRHNWNLSKKCIEYFSGNCYNFG